MHAYYRPHTEYDGKVMFSVCLFTGGPQVKVWGGPPRSRSKSRSGAPQVKVWGAPEVKVQINVQGAPWSRSGSRSGGALGVPPPEWGVGAPGGNPPNLQGQGYPPELGGAPGGTPLNWGAPKGTP